jgi:hypothetical protein
LRGQCAGITREGRRCTHPVNAPQEEFCHLHDPRRADVRRKAASRAGKAKPPTREVRDLKAEVRDVIESIRSGDLDRNDGAVMLQGYRTLKDFIELERRIRESEGFEERLALLEAALEERNARRGGVSRW